MPSSVSPLFSILSRLKLIQRWSLMRSTVPENVQEHSHRVACIAHALAVIGSRVFGKRINAERAALLGLYHGAGEALTGDLPTPVKYANPELRDAYAKIEDAARDRMLAMTPEALREDFRPLFFPAPADADEQRLVYAADKICAWLKCVEERRGGNHEFLQAEATLRAKVAGLDLPEAAYFVEHFAPAFELTLDELESTRNFAVARSENCR